ncbi:type II toxin-antitoxin system VapC family toxin [Phenylobacterium sp.]|uniref:type II toxin-antitoxin system VapC family toxin n=1 Tax=Phenylobacterium sp. TaxID=1871053 RepID=UPI002CF6508F|nr:PIN domain-containing protein [Phenylobacterium sp.]HVI32060.1 PIN domain-containing protein [Phenylobacterium sp.]
MAALDLYYWDACIFYEYLMEDQPDAHKAQAVTDILDENKQRRNRICTSVITHSEVVPKKIGGNAEQRYWDCFGSTFFYDVEVDRSAILLAREIRDYYYRPPEDSGGYRLMGTPDALHLAAAILNGAAEFHTRDGKRRGGNVPLLGLDSSSPGGKLCGKYELKIISPTAQQLRIV